MRSFTQDTMTGNIYEVNWLTQLYQRRGHVLLNVSACIEGHTGSGRDVRVAKLYVDRDFEKAAAVKADSARANKTELGKVCIFPCLWIRVNSKQKRYYQNATFDKWKEGSWRNRCIGESLKLHRSAKSSARVHVY